MVGGFRVQGFGGLSVLGMSLIYSYFEEGGGGGVGFRV